MKNNNKIIKLILVIIILLLVVILIFNTYSKYTGQANGEINKDLAVWKIKVNGTYITDYDTPEVNDDGSVGVKFDIKDDDFVWEGDPTKSHISEKKVAPGMTGTFKITIDPTDTQVALKYTLKIDDTALSLEGTTINLKVTDIKLNGTSVNPDDYRDSADSNIIHYEKVKTLDKVESTTQEDRVDTIEVTVIWENNEDNNDADSKVGSKFDNVLKLPVTLNFKQYTGV